MGRTLYHFPTSPYSRRVRLALAHKRLDIELVDARAMPEARAVAAKKWPLRTVPVLVDGDVALGDSTAIVRWLDHAYPERPVLRNDHVGLAVGALADGMIDGLVNAGTRYFFPNDPGWPAVKAEVIARIEGAADALVSFLPELGGWTFAEMSLYTAIAWIEGFPARMATNTNIQQIVSLGFTVPRPLSAWAAQHAERDDVRALS